jgi:hypothetical protein
MEQERLAISTALEALRQRWMAADRRRVALHKEFVKLKLYPELPVWGETLLYRANEEVRVVWSAMQALMNVQRLTKEIKS